MAKPTHFSSEQELDEFITRPDQEVMDMLSKLDGDIMILGIGGKVGNHVGLMIQRGIDTLGIDKRVYGVSRFSDQAAKNELEENGIATISCDLLDLEEVKKLPQVKNIIFMAGKKFGTSGSTHVTWAMNTLVPKNVCEHFSDSRFVAFSTGCVYDLMDIKQMGAIEENDITPVGDYSNSAVGRERVFEYYAETHKLPTLLFRLNYAIDLRYGVL
ncbi:NAD-dependent epimerase/dehydratase family protein, partial [Vibrio kyushuensis]|uniref:NAD-dependent epimerase/dehydratase family protein n=1 Tax=Vibrio kyushuensis TaxID=2910249 RepID=UPI003D0E593F